MATKLGTILKSLSKRDVNAIKSIYNHRCLTINQLYELHYMKSLRDDNEIVSDSYCKKKVNDFVELEIIEKIEHFDEDVLFLTPMGIEVVRQCFDLPTNIYDYEKRVVRRGYYRASELKISSKYINHQLALNQFMIDFIKEEYDIYWKYYDEKYISQFRNIRPDGLLNMLDTDFFIEIDMATESKKQLYDKWENYRRFLSSREFQYIERKIVVLFVIENTFKPQARIDLVKHTLSERILDLIGKNFEVYIDTKDNILKILDEKIKIAKRDKYDEYDEILKSMINSGFSVALGEKLNEHFNGAEFDFYCRKIDENNHIVIEKGKVQEYIVDSYKYAPFSVLKKVAYLVHTNLYFKEKFNRKLSYIIVGEDEESLYRDLRIMDLLVVDNVYLTTLDRLKTMPFHKALFQFDFLGNIHSFLNSGLQDREFLCNINDFSDKKEKE